MNVESVEQAVLAVPGVRGVNVRLTESPHYDATGREDGTEIRISAIEYTGDVEPQIVFSAVVRGSPPSVMPPTPNKIDPIPVELSCPECGTPHIDQDEWVDRPHRSHRCAACLRVWRPYDHPTVGVESPLVSLLKRGVQIQSHDGTVCVQRRPDRSYVLYGISRTGNHAGNTQLLGRTQDPFEAADWLIEALDEVDRPLRAALGP